MPTVWAQQHFRLRNDDGSQTAATWIAATDTNATINVTAGDVKLRLRLSVAQTGSTAAALTATLYFAINGSATYNAMTASTADVHAASSTFVTDDAATTQQISSGTFVAGKIDTATGACTATASMATNAVTEHEWCVLLVSADQASGDTLDFRVRNTTTALNTYTLTPRITIQKSTVIAVDGGSTNNLATDSVKGAALWASLAAWASSSVVLGDGLAVIPPPPGGVGLYAPRGTTQPIAGGWA